MKDHTVDCQTKNLALPWSCKFDWKSVAIWLASSGVVDLYTIQVLVSKLYVAHATEHVTFCWLQGLYPIEEKGEFTDK